MQARKTNDNVGRSFSLLPAAIGNVNTEYILVQQERALCVLRGQTISGLRWRVAGAGSKARSEKHGRSCHSIIVIKMG